MHCGFASESNCSLFINEYFYLDLINLSKLQYILAWLNWKWMPWTSQICSVLNNKGLPSYELGVFAREICMIHKILFSYTFVSYLLRCHLNSHMKYNCYIWQLFTLPTSSCPCAVDNIRQLKTSSVWGHFAVFNAFLHSWCFHTLYRLQEAFSEVAVGLFPLKSLEKLLFSLSQAKVNFFENSIMFVYARKKRLQPTKIKVFSESLASWCYIWGIHTGILLYDLGE